jgi:hypothetical protein
MIFDRIGLSMVQFTSPLWERGGVVAQIEPTRRAAHFFLLPLWEKVARTKSVPDEGSVSARAVCVCGENPSPVSIAPCAIDPPSPTRGEGRGSGFPTVYFSLAIATPSRAN